MGANEVRVVLYGHDCCPGTATARAYFARRRVVYVMRDISDGQAAMEFQALGAWVTPAVVLDGRLIMIGFDPEAFEDAFARAQGL